MDHSNEARPRVPQNPLAMPGGGYLCDLLEQLSDDEVDDTVAYYLDRRENFRAKGDGFSAWWCSKIASAAFGNSVFGAASIGGPAMILTDPTDRLGRVPRSHRLRA